MKGVLLLLAVAGILGAAANAVSPRGISWMQPLGSGLASDVAAAGLFPVAMKDLPGLLQDRSILYLDARSREDYATGHLPRAVWSNPEGPLPPRDRPIIVYCSNEFCHSSLQLGVRLKKEGFRNVGVLVDGYDAWWNAGGSVEQD